jgi:hypothetical protein
VSDASEDLNLSADGPGGRRRKFPLKHYVAIYGTKVRALARWNAIGLSADPPDEPPLDFPEEMPAWWGRHSPHKVPPKLLAAAARHRRGEAPPAAVDEKPHGTTARSGATETKPPPPPADFGSVEALTLSELLETSRVAVSFLIRQQRKEAEQSFDSDNFARRQREIDKMLEQIRKTESSIESIRQKRGELVDIAKVREELQRVHTAMAMSLENELVDTLKIPRERARHFVNDWFAHLRGSEFTSGTAPAVAA